MKSPILVDATINSPGQGGVRDMLDYLEQLVKDAKWEEALFIAEQMVQRTDNTVQDMVRINVSLLAARTSIGEYSGVVMLGDHAAGMAADTENWDAYLTVCHYVGFAYACLNRIDLARNHWFDYINKINHYDGHHPYEIMTWCNLGVSALQEGDYRSSVFYYEQARKVTLSRGTKRQLLGVNHALITAYTRLHEYQKVPRLLAQSLHYLRNNENAEEWLKARLFHFKVRAEFGLATKRYQRARLVATRCLQLAGELPEHRYYMHIILASVARETQEYDRMVDHYTLARVAAIRARRYDCELYAAEGLYQFLQSHPEEFRLASESASESLPTSWFDSDDPLRL